MADPDFPEGLREFVQHCIPHVDAAEVLLLLVREPKRTFMVSEIIEMVRPADLGDAIARKYLALFEERGLISHRDGAYQFDPATPQSQEIAHALAKLYKERPVTLVRLIYSLKDVPLRAFADAFKLKKP